VLDGLADKIGHDNIFVSTHDAVREALSQISQSSDLDLEEQTTDRDDQQTRLALPNIPSDDFQPDATDVSQTEDNNAHAIVSN
jgi:hypothetical protein